MPNERKRSNKISTLQPPQNLEAEMTVIGSILKDAAITPIALALKPEDFYHPKHQLIWTNVVALHDEDSPVDIVTLSNKLAQSGNLISSHLVECMEMVGSTANIEHHVAIVKDKALSRTLIRTMNEIVNEAYAMEMPISDILGRAESQILDVVSRTTDTKAESLTELLPAIIANLDEWNSGRKEKTLVRTKWPDVNNVICGIERGEFFIIAGRPSQGKSEAAIEIAEYVAKTTFPVHFFGLEMRNLMVGTRAFLSEARLSLDTFKRRKATEQDWDRIAKTQAKLHNVPVYFTDVVGLTPNQLRVIAHKSKVKNGIGMVVVDYIQLMSGDGRPESRLQEVSYVSRELKKIGLQLDVAMVGVSQMNRLIEHTGGYRRPKLSDLRESGSLEQDADTVMFIDWRGDNKTAQQGYGYYFDFEKVRNGACGDAPMNMIEGRWESAAREEIV